MSDLPVQARGVATGGAWGSRSPPVSPNTLFGTRTFRRILTHVSPMVPDLPDLALSLSFASPRADAIYML